MYLICHLTSYGYLIQRACEFLGGNFLCYVTTLIILVVISIVMVDIMFLNCHVTSFGHMFKRLR